MSTIPSYLGNWGKRVNFGNGAAEILTKVWEREREKEKKKKVGERKFWISVISLPKFLLPKRADRVGVKCLKCASARGCPKGNQLWQCHCWNRKGGKFVAIVAMPLPKMGGKKIVVAKIWGGIKKKQCATPQYFYNIFTTNHRWLVIISSNLNLTLKLLF